MSFRGLSLSEAWRLAGPLNFVTAMVWKAMAIKGDYQWLPALQAEKACRLEDLTDAAKEKLVPLMVQLRDLGYTSGYLTKVAINLNGKFRDGAVYHALHRDGRKVMGLIYVHIGPPKGPRFAQVKRVQIEGAFVVPNPLSPLGLSIVSVTNNKKHLDYGQLCRPIVMPRRVRLERLAQRLDKELGKVTERVVSFNSLQEAWKTIFSLEEQMWSGRIARGLFYKVPPDEERRVLNEFGYSPPASTTAYTAPRG